MSWFVLAEFTVLIDEQQDEIKKRNAEHESQQRSQQRPPTSMGMRYSV